MSVEVVATYEYGHGVPTEAEEQALLVDWLRWSGFEVAHIPNGGYRTIRAAGEMKRLGQLKGMPDLFVFERAPATGQTVWVEMKRRKGGTLSKDQRRVHDMLRARGDAVIVAKGADDAVRQLRALGYEIVEPTGEPPF